MQCYIVLYSQEGYFLTFTKRNKGYFFQGKNGSPGSIYPEGVALKSGPGVFAFPGGEQNNGEAPYEGCLREFIEECGNQIVFNYIPANQPPSLSTLNNISINGSHFSILGSVLTTTTLTKSGYYTLYLEFDIEDLEQIEALILDTNLEEAINAQADIIDGNFGTYEAIFNIYPFCPLDNELEDAELWQVQGQISQIRLLRKNIGVTDWYFNMIDYLANRILKLNIPY